MHVALGGVNADPDVLAGGFGDVPGAEVSHLSRLHGAHAGVADPDSAAKGELQTSLLAGLQNGCVTTTFGGGVAIEEGDLPALPRCGVAADLGLKPLVVQLLGLPVALPVFDERVKELTWPRTERRAFPPVRAQIVELLG